MFSGVTSSHDTEEKVTSYVTPGVPFHYDEELFSVFLFLPLCLERKKTHSTRTHIHFKNFNTGKTTCSDAQRTGRGVADVTPVITAPKTFHQHVLH